MTRRLRPRHAMPADNVTFGLWTEIPNPPSASKRNDCPSRQLLVCENRLEIPRPRLKGGTLLTSVSVQVVVPPRDAGLHVIQDLRDEVLRHPCVRHQRGRRPAKIVRDELEAAALAKPLNGLLDFFNRALPRARWEHVLARLSRGLVLLSSIQRVDLDALVLVAFR